MSHPMNDERKWSGTLADLSSAQCHALQVIRAHRRVWCGWSKEPEDLRLAGSYDRINRRTLGWLVRNGLVERAAEQTLDGRHPFVLSPVGTRLLATGSTGSTRHG